VRYHLVTLGCPKNVVDSERLEGLLRQAHHQPTVRPSDADLLFVNTCGFIDSSKEESINAILRLAERKRPGQRLVVAGCLTQLYGDEVQQEIPEIDNVFGVEDWERVAAVAGQSDEAPWDIPCTSVAEKMRASAYLKISDGCNAPCTFCIIPTIKGRFTSASAGAVVAEAQRLAAMGVRELVLVAQDSTAWGEDLGLRDGLAGLIRLIASSVPQVPWIRLMYAYPGRVTDQLIRTMAEVPQVCHYLDVPLQHGSVDVLRRMRRPANMTMVRGMIADLRSAMPDIALRTSLIVGFPGETDQEFGQLLEFVAEIRFDHLGVFTYSAQERTPAASMQDQLPERTKRRRRARLMQLQEQISLEKNQALIGRELKVLVDEQEIVRAPRGSSGGLFVARTYRDAPEVDGLVFCQGKARARDMPLVRITEALPHDLIAEVVTVEAGCT
jgi:ribosomal protein S12 methylthiotransferase